MKNIIKNAMILTVITLVSGLLLGFVYDITKEPIAQAKEQAKKEAYHHVDRYFVAGIFRGRIYHAVPS